MGLGGGSGYEKLNTQTPGQQNIMQQIERWATGQEGVQDSELYKNSVAGVNQFLPGGGGGKPIADEAYRLYNQRTVPTIMNAFAPMLDPWTFS